MDAASGRVLKIFLQGVFFGQPCHSYNLPLWLQHIFENGFLSIRVIKSFTNLPIRPHQNNAIERGMTHKMMAT